MVENYETEQEEQELSGIDLLILTCKSPFKAFKYINDTGYDAHMKLLISLVGLTAMINPESIKQLEYSMSFVAAICVALVMGFILIWISALLTSSIISWTGGWLGGEGETMPVLRVLAYTSIPAIISNILQIILFAFTEQEYPLVLKIIFSIWGLVLGFIAIKEVQQFSILKTILNGIFTIIIVFVVAFVFSYLLVNIFR